MELVRTFAFWLAMGVLTLYLIACLKRLVDALFPHDPPPLQDGESISSRLGKLHW